MSPAPDQEKLAEMRAERARSALLSDIRDLKTAGNRAVVKVESRLPWLIGGALGLLIVGAVVAVARASHRRSLAADEQAAWRRRAMRGAALSAASFVARRLVERALSSEPKRAQQAPEPEATLG